MITIDIHRTRRLTAAGKQYISNTRFSTDLVRQQQHHIRLKVTHRRQLVILAVLLANNKQAIALIP
jgi:hypothetical protein